MRNQLVGVLIRFCQEQLAVIGDIKSMSYQVWVSEKHRSLLRFLWWKDGDLNNPPIDHEMVRHVFGVVSSPSCTNYALKKTADHNNLKYGLEAADTLNNNLYVDDMLKSVASVLEAITLVKNVRGMCRTGSFRLTICISNSKELLMSIPQKHRRQ